MRTNRVKQALREGKVQLGTSYGQIRSQEVAKILAAAGFQWAFIDTEHGGFGIETVQDVCRVSNLVGLCPIVRVADLQYALIARALDCGAQGIIFPRVESAELLQTAVNWMKFPPEGVRGCGVGPINVDWEPVSLPELTAHFNANIMVVLQIETRRAVEMRDELLSVPGIDAVMIGPVDLSISYGVPGDFQHPKMVEAMELIKESCEKHGVAPGTQTRTVTLAKFWRDRGMRFLGCSGDTTMLFERAKDLVSQLSMADGAAR
ncbi:MAG TPA: aldolase/citrate lyase family protein [Bryobacteraceae bacterium]|nr:aldolase/citrate lyase family protein [Bryobacteraceae bacterium]